MKGGGTVGKIGFPAYMEAAHTDWIGPNNLTTTLINVMETAFTNPGPSTGNPWENHALIDPATDLAKVDTTYDDLELNINGLDEKLDWKGIVDEAVTKVDTAGVLKDIDLSSIFVSIRSDTDLTVEAAISKALSMVESDLVDSLVDQFEKRSTKQKARLINRFNSTMADINAVQSSAFLFGTALIEAEHLNNVNNFQAQVNLELFRQGIDTYVRLIATDLESRIRTEVVNKTHRDQTLENGVQLMTRLLINKVDFKTKKTALLSELKRVKFLQQTEFELKDAALDHNFAQWDFEVFGHGIQILGGLGGGSFIPPTASPLASAISGGLSGAATGALAGSALGPPGAAIGAIIGAGLGVGASLS